MEGTPIVRAKPKGKKPRADGPIDPDKLKAYVERIERVEELIAAERDARADIYTEVKASGMKPKRVRQIIKERAKKEIDEAEEAELELYRAALAMPGATYRSVAAATGASKSKLQRLVPRNANGTDSIDPETGEITETASARPPCDGAGTTVLNSGPGSSVATISDAAPEGRVDGGLTSAVPPSATPQAGEVAAFPVTPAPDEGVGTGTISTGNQAQEGEENDEGRGTYAVGGGADRGGSGRQVAAEGGLLPGRPARDPEGPAEGDRAEADALTLTPEAAVSAPPVVDLCGCETCVSERIEYLKGVAAATNSVSMVTLPGPHQPGWRYACEVCGNKRCPHHTDHMLACTGSNEPGQPGSSWENYSSEIPVFLDRRRNRGGPAPAQTPPPLDERGEAATQ